MKFFSTLIAFFICASTFAQDFQNAGQYMEYIGKQQENVTKKYLTYSSAVAHGKKAKKVDNLRSKLLVQPFFCEKKFTFTDFFYKVSQYYFTIHFMLLAIS